MCSVTPLAEYRPRKHFNLAMDSIKLAYAAHLLDCTKAGTKPLRTRAPIEAAIPKGCKVKYFKATLTSTSARLTFEASMGSIKENMTITFTWR